MNLRKWFLTGAAGALSMALAIGANAQDTLNDVNVNGYAFVFESALGTTLAVERLQADPVTDAYPGGPKPARTVFSIADAISLGEGGFQPNVVITFYRVSDLAGYPVEAEYTALTQLLAERPVLADQATLPFLETVPASQVLRAREEYYDTLGFNGIVYLTAFAQDASPLTSDRFVYTFHGISLDGEWAVTAQFDTAPASVTNEIAADFDYDAFAADFDNYVATLRADLNAETTFTPSLDFARQTIATLARYDVSVTGMGETPAMPEMEPTAVVNTDPTLGGLAGTWNLVSYGPADAPVAVVAEFPVSITFSETGVNGRACNSFSGNFTYAENTLTIGPVASTMMACPEPGMGQETAFYNALNTASAYTIAGDTLTITTADGVLTLTRAA